MLDTSRLLPRFEFVGQSAQLTRMWLETLKTCDHTEIDRWADKGVTEAFVTYKVSVICKDKDGHRIGGQRLFKLRTEEAQLGFMTYLQTQRNSFENISPQ